MKLGMEAGLGPDYIVLDGNPAAPLPLKGAQPPIFILCLLWLNGCRSQPLLIEKLLVYFKAPESFQSATTTDGSENRLNCTNCCALCIDEKRRQRRAFNH